LLSIPLLLHKANELKTYCYFHSVKILGRRSNTYQAPVERPILA